MDAPDGGEDRCGQLVFGPDSGPSSLADEPVSDGVVSVLFEHTPDEWRRAWRSTLDWTPDKEAIVDVTDITRSAAVAESVSPSPSHSSRSGADVSLTTLSRPIDPREVVSVVEEYLPPDPVSDILVVVDAVGELVDAELAAIDRLQTVIAEADARLVCCVSPNSLDPDVGQELETRFLGSSMESGRSLRAEVASLRTRDPTTYGYVRQNWREARRGIERCPRNYPQAKQVHQELTEPGTTPRTLGTTLSGLVTLGVIDVWSETVGSTRYDLTAYDSNRLERLGRLLDAQSE